MLKQSEDNNHTTRINVFSILHTVFFPTGGPKNLFFLLEDHKVDFIAPIGVNKSIL